MVAEEEVWEDEEAFDWRAAAIDSRVGMETSSLGEVGGRVTIATRQRKRLETR